MKLSHTGVVAELKKVARRDKAQFLPKFFQAYPGGYGEGDQFLGVVVPDQRKIARQFRELSRADIAKLLKSPWHECRLTGLLILVHQFERAGKGAAGDQGAAERQEIVDFYLSHLTRLNNWDLVDSSAHKILGQYLLKRRGRRKLLDKLARSKNLWEQRVSVIATMPLIHHEEFDDFLRLARKFLGHPHDLMHKAVGWMLREMGKRDISQLRAFLDQHVSEMPRTMLRYAIEKLPQPERKRWLARE